MPFDVKKYKNTTFVHREFDFPLPPVFKEFFDKEDKLVWRIRGLTGQELGFVSENASRNKNIASMMEAISEGSYQKLVKMYRELAGADKDKVPQKIAEAMEQLVIASVYPVADLELIVLLCTRAAETFLNMSLKVNALTSGGMVPGKQKGSGKEKISEPA